MNSPTPTFSSMGVRCPVCHSEECVSMTSGLATIFWCAEGHVTLYDLKYRSIISTIDLSAIADYGSRTVQTNN